MPIPTPGSQPNPKPQVQPRNIQISATSTPKRSAAAIAGAIEAYRQCTVQAVGPHATLNAVASLEIAARYLKNNPRIAFRTHCEPITNGIKQSTLVTFDVFPHAT